MGVASSPPISAACESAKSCVGGARQNCSPSKRSSALTTPGPPESARRHPPANPERDGAAAAAVRARDRNGRGAGRRPERQIDQRAAIRRTAEKARLYSRQPVDQRDDAADLTAAGHGPRSRSGAMADAVVDDRHEPHPRRDPLPPRTGHGPHHLGIGSRPVPPPLAAVATTPTVRDSSTLRNRRERERDRPRVRDAVKRVTTSGPEHAGGPGRRVGLDPVDRIRWWARDAPEPMDVDARGRGRRKCRAIQRRARRRIDVRGRSPPPAAAGSRAAVARRCARCTLIAGGRPRGRRP